MIHGFTRKLRPLLAAAVLLLTLAACREQPAETTEPTQTTQLQTEATTLPQTEPTETEPTETEPQEERFTLTFVGDCTLGSSPGLRYAQASFPNLMGEDYGYPFRNVLSYFENDDLTLINLEGVFTESNAAADKTFTFKGPPEYINILTQNSVEAVTLANNHTLDYHRTGYEDTKALLDEAAVAYVEKDGSKLVTTESGLTVGLYAASFTIDFEDLQAEVQQLRDDGAEIVIFAIHWGQEGFYKPHTHQIQQAYDAIDAGVDIVYGSHPHVLQKIEEYNDGIIFYSLGNFAFGGNHWPPDLDSVLLQQEIIRQPDGTVTMGELTIVPCSMSSIPKQNNFQPTPYEEGSEEYDRAMSKLDGTWKGYNLNVSY